MRRPGSSKPSVRTGSPPADVDTSLEGLKEAARRQSEKRQNELLRKSTVKGPGRSTVDETHTVVVGGASLENGTNEKTAVSLLEASNDEEMSEDSFVSSEDEDEEDSAGEEENVHQSEEEPDDDASDEEEGVQGLLEDATQDEDMADIGSEQSDDDERLEPSFGEIASTEAAEAIDVDGAFDEALSSSKPITQRSRFRVLPPPPAASLGTVLTQALKTNDNSLLESCLHTSDTAIVRSTIQRIDSSLSRPLLEKIAERLHSRPGRAGILMVWVQWTLVSHGGYLASQPEVMAQLSTLHRVVKERAHGLQPLLSLKGKLDMLEAQMSLRRNMRNHASRHANNDDNDATVIYVEGQEDSESDAASRKRSRQDKRRTSTKPRKRSRTETQDEASIEDAAMEDDDLMPTTTNGVLGDSDDEADSESDEEGPIDYEAEETDADSGDEADSQDLDEEIDEDNDEDSVEGSGHAQGLSNGSGLSGPTSSKRRDGLPS
ncbi:MAG: hypothetical protein M1825_001123 [Sarcosagium campestre]|nr:MAG: hypothetical protein M1825_001123 [Sarcosagium campestre]